MKALIFVKNFFSDFDPFEAFVWSGLGFALGVIVWMVVEANFLKLVGHGSYIGFVFYAIWWSGTNPWKMALVLFVTMTLTVVLFSGG